jgi:hypothetical protein
MINGLHNPASSIVIHIMYIVYLEFYVYHSIYQRVLDEILGRKEDINEKHRKGVVSIPFLGQR